MGAHFQGLQHLVTNIHDSVYRVANRQGVGPDDVRAALATVMLPDIAANQRYLMASGRLETMARSLSRVMLNEGMIATEPRFRGLSDSSFLPGRVS